MQGSILSEGKGENTCSRTLPSFVLECSHSCDIIPEYLCPCANLPFCKDTGHFGLRPALLCAVIFISKESQELRNGKVGFEYTDSEGHSLSHNREAKEKIVFGWPSWILSGTRERMEVCIVRKVNIEEAGRKEGTRRNESQCKDQRCLSNASCSPSDLPWFHSNLQSQPLSISQDPMHQAVFSYHLTQSLQQSWVINYVIDKKS